MWATGSGLLSNNRRLQGKRSTEAARRQGATRPPGAARRRLVARAPHILHNARHVRIQTLPRRAFSCSPGRVKVRSEAKIRSCARLPSCRSDDEIEAASGGRRRSRRGVARPPSCVLLIITTIYVCVFFKCVRLQFLSYDCRLACSALLYTHTYR